jgi:simple sugar transport system permease protein
MAEQGTSIAGRLRGAPAHLGLSRVLGVVVALVFTSLVLVLAGASPLAAFGVLWQGALGTPDRQSNVLMAMVPLLLCSAGLLLTFATGLWNIGIEGQIVLGAIGATWVVRAFALPPELMLPLILAGGMVAGALWALLAGLLKVYGHVHEIFGGLGLNFIAVTLTTYLVFGPWKQRTGATMSGTEPFPQAYWLPTLPNVSLSPLALGLAVIALVIVYFSVRGTLWGLQLRSVGKNIRSAFLLGLPTHRLMLSAFALCGALAGLAGAIQATGLFHRLIPSISSGYGFLAILVVLLASFRALWVAPIALFFAAVSRGGTQLQIELGLDSSLGGVLQGALVLGVLLTQGIEFGKQRQPADDRPAVSEPNRGAQAEDQAAASVELQSGSH